MSGLPGISGTTVDPQGRTGDEPFGNEAADLEPPGSRLRRFEPLAAGLLVLVALLPVLIVIVTRAGRPYLPVGDFATIDLRVRDVWSWDVPLVGPYSRFGWNHPGPAMYWLIAPLSVLTGGAAWATLVGAAALQGAAIAWLGWLAWAKGRIQQVAIWMAIVALAYAGTGSWMLLQPWNPYVAFPFFALLIFQLWALASGDLDRLPGAAFVATFLVQTHVGYVPLAMALGGWAILRVLWGRRGTSEPVWRLRAVRRASLVLGVMWFPVFLDIVLHFPGNLPHTVHNLAYGSRHGAPLGLRAGAGLLATEFRWLPPWVGGRERFADLSGFAVPADLFWLAGPAALIVGAAVVARRSRRADLICLTELLGLLLIVSVATMARIAGDPIPYLFDWRLIVGSSIVILGVWTITHVELPFHRAWCAPVLVAVLCAGIAWSSGALAVSVATATRTTDELEPVARSLVDQLRAESEPSRPVLVRYAGADEGGRLEAGLIDELARGKAPVRVDGGRPFRYGYRRVATTKDVSAVWYVAENGAALSRLSGLPGARVLVQTTPLDASDEAELVALQRAVSAQFVRVGHPELIDALSTPLAAFAAARVSGSDVVAAGRIGDLNAKAAKFAPCRCGVVGFAPGDDPSFR